jgi:hypothetical protein
MLHNFIRRTQDYEDEYDESDSDDDDEDEEEDVDDDEEDADAGGDYIVSFRTKRQLNAWKDGIARAMWADYQVEVNLSAARGRVMP